MEDCRVEGLLLEAEPGMHWDILEEGAVVEVVGLDLGFHLDAAQLSNLVSRVLLTCHQEICT